MNTFKGLLISYNSMELGNYIKPSFEKQLINMNSSNDITVSEEFKEYADRLLPLLQNNDNFMTHFERSGEKNPKDYAGSFINYLRKLFDCYRLKTNETRIVNCLKDKINYWCEDEFFAENKKNYEINLSLISSLSNGLKLNASTLGYRVNSMIFIEEFHEKNTLSAGEFNGTSFWLSNKDNLESVTIYDTKPRLSNNSLFNESLSNKLIQEFKNKFPEEVIKKKKNQTSYFKEFTEVVNNFFDNKFTSNEKISLNPLLFFKIEHSMPMINESLIKMSEDEKQNLMTLAITSEGVENQLFNNNIKPELSIIYLTKKESNQDLLLMQKSIDETTKGCVYELKKGDLEFVKACKKNNELLKPSTKQVELSNEEKQSIFKKEVLELFKINN